jgi:hypothetical protein
MSKKPINEVYSRNRLISFIKTYQDRLTIKAAGSDTEVQFNNGGVFSADHDLVWNTSTGDGLGIGLHDVGTTPKVHLDVNYGYVDDLTANTGGGESVVFGTGTTVTGMLYYLNTSGVWTATDASAVASGASQLLGIALGTDAAANGMLLRGFFQLVEGQAGTWNEGVPLYLSTTAGKVHTTAPAAAGNFVRVVGYCGAGTTNMIYFNPDGTYIEIS